MWNLPLREDIPGHGEGPGGFAAETKYNPIITPFAQGCFWHWQFGVKAAFLTVQTTYGPLPTHWSSTSNHQHLVWHQAMVKKERPWLDFTNDHFQLVFGLSSQRPYRWEAPDRCWRWKRTIRKLLVIAWKKWSLLKDFDRSDLRYTSVNQIAWKLGWNRIHNFEAGLVVHRTKTNWKLKRVEANYAKTQKVLK